MQGIRQRQLVINDVILGIVAPVSHSYGDVGRISVREDKGIQEALEEPHDGSKTRCGPTRNNKETTTTAKN